MNPDFQKIIDQMEPLLQQLITSSPHTLEDGLRNLPQRGSTLSMRMDRPSTLAGPTEY